MTVWDTIKNTVSLIFEARKYEEACKPHDLSAEYSVAMVAASDGVLRAYQMGYRMFQGGHSMSHVERKISQAVVGAIIDTLMDEKQEAK
jgi:hypothetical protein